MSYQNKKIASAAEKLKAELEKADEPQSVLRSPLLKSLYAEIPTLDPKERGAFGKEINALKQELEQLVASATDKTEALPDIDVTAPFDTNAKRPELLSAQDGSIHPLTAEIATVVDIFARMGMEVVSSRQIDNDYNMFTALNFPEGHPARDDYDTFMTEEGLIAPAHTSTMQNRILRAGAAGLKDGKPIAAVIPDRVFRNEDVDATHEHTFTQLEGIYVGKGITVGMLIKTLSVYLSEYFGQQLNTKIQPFYFPFTEPSFEFAVERPDILKKDDSEEQKWLELGGCGMIHPNVLKMAGIDPEIYTGFAWGFGIERMIMMKYGIDDVRHFHSGKLAFLRQF